ncbi:TGS domain-containing protein, partial [Candidatus Fermentibacterales bacterium]|nr:TGS domain-containing protein [Candidatus Fermentibacterales bacterium]
MRPLRITFPDGDTVEYAPGTTALDVARSVSKSLASKALVCRFDGRLLDLGLPLPGDGAL